MSWHLHATCMYMLVHANHEWNVGRNSYSRYAVIPSGECILNYTPASLGISSRPGTFWVISETNQLVITPILWDINPHWTQVGSGYRLNPTLTACQDLQMRIGLPPRKAREVRGLPEVCYPVSKQVLRGGCDGNLLQSPSYGLVVWTAWDQ